MGNRVQCTDSSLRIVSLVPSQTELLFDLGLDSEVVGITKYCIHPPHWQQEKMIVGGTKNVELTKIKSLQPNLIIGNKEENTKDAILTLQQNYPVWMSDIQSFDDAMAMIEGVGLLVDRQEKAKSITAAIRAQLASLTTRPKKRVLYLIWRKPWMGAGTDTFIDSMLGKIGLENALQRPRYPELSDAQIEHLQAEVVLLSSEPYPFKEKHIAEIQKLLPESKILLVDGEMFSWYGSRLLQAAAYFNTLAL